jgi:serine/threonine protein kinase
VYGRPAGRQSLSDSSLQEQYRVVRTLDPGRANGGVGNLNEGVELVKKKDSGKGQLCVLKRIRVKPKHSAILKREIEILHVLKHPNIVGFIDGYIPANFNGQAHLVLEYCDRGNLRDLIIAYVEHNNVDEDDESFFPEGFLWHVFEALASALAYIHHGVMGEDLRMPSVLKDRDEWPLILHRDLKPENIFLQTWFPGGSSKLLNKMSAKLSRKQPQHTRNESHYPRVALGDFVSHLPSKKAPTY